MEDVGPMLPAAPLNKPDAVIAQENRIKIEVMEVMVATIARRLGMLPHEFFPTGPSAADWGDQRHWKEIARICALRIS